MKRIKKLEKFFGVKRPRNTNTAEWLFALCKMVGEWEDAHRRQFPIQ